MKLSTLLELQEPKTLTGIINDSFESCFPPTTLEELYNWYLNFTGHSDLRGKWEIEHKLARIMFPLHGLADKKVFRKLHKRALVVYSQTFGRRELSTIRAFAFAATYFVIPSTMHTQQRHFIAWMNENLINYFEHHGVIDKKTTDAIMISLKQKPPIVISQTIQNIKRVFPTFWSDIDGRSEEFYRFYHFILTELISTFVEFTVDSVRKNKPREFSGL